MARPKKTKEVAPGVVESLEEAQSVSVDISVEDANLIQKENLEARKLYLYHLREDLVNEGIDSIGKLDIMLSKVLQEIESLK